MDDRQLDSLLDELGEHMLEYIGGKKFPRKLRFDELSAIAERMQSETDKGVALREHKIVEGGDVLACRQGCNGCCEEPIMVFQPEAARVWRWLQLPANKAARSAFLAAYKPWKARVGATLDELSKLFDDDENYLAAHTAAWRLRALCPFNVEGDCSIYPVRPVVCRTGHALTTSEFCHGGTDKPAQRVDFVPLDEFVLNARRLMLAAHNATRANPRGRPQSLPEAVHALLSG